MAPPAFDPLFNLVIATFESNGWRCEQVPDLLVVESGFEAHHCRVPLHVQVFPEVHVISVVAQASISFTDPDRRARAAELLMFANQRLSVGAFEMRWEEGEILFRQGNLFAPDKLDASVVTAMVEIAVIEVDRLTPLLHVLTRCTANDLIQLSLPAMLEDPSALPEVEPPQTQNS